jgi:hypothetical protein
MVLDGTMPKLASYPLALAAALSLSLTACSGDDKSSGSPSTPPPSSTPSATSSATSPAPTTPAPSASGPVQRTAAQLTKALLELKDLPSGFSLEPNEPDDGSAGTFSSKDSKCKTLVTYLNADKAPGSKATAYRAFSGGQEGPFIDFSLDSLGTSQAVAALATTYRNAVASCKKVSLKIPGEGTSTMGVTEISAPQFGDKPFAFRLTGTSGPREGLEFTAAVTGVSDVILSVSVLAGQPGELDGATEAAVDKARTTLGTPKTGT